MKEEKRETKKKKLGLDVISILIKKIKVSFSINDLLISRFIEMIEKKNILQITINN